MSFENTSHLSSRKESAMDKNQIVTLLRDEIASCEVSGEAEVTISKEMAVEILSLLTNLPAGKKGEKVAGKRAFYCVSCEKTFWSDGAEDKDCFRKYQYHSWTADCPSCGDRVVINDRYWR